MITRDLPYEIIAYRYGNRDEGYVVAHACDEITAGRIAYDEQDLRGGKYKMEVKLRDTGEING